MPVVAHTNIEMACPVQIGLRRDGSDLWVLPIEPTVSVRASKTIIKRAVQSAAGRRGSVKEEWAVDDYQITVNGLFQSPDGRFPAGDVARLDALLKEGGPLQIRCLLLDVLGITQLAVESWDFPETSGLENQTYAFSGSSDEDIELLV